MISAVSHCASRPPPTTCPSSSTTEKAEHRNGPPTRGIAPLKKTIYSLIDLREILVGCNRRYLAHLSALDDFSAGVRALGRLSKPHEVDGKTVKGIYFFEPGDSALLHALQNPSVNIAGIRRAELRPEPGNVLARSAVTTTTPAARPGVIKRIKGTYTLLPDQSRSRCHRRSRAAQAGNRRSGYDLIGFRRRI